jgi:hypothetical protein
MLCYRGAIKAGNEMFKADLKRGLLIVVLALASVPAVAQQQTGFDRINFVKAVREGDGAKVRELFDKYGKIILNAHDTDGDTALTIAVRKRHDWAYFFLREGADPDEPGAEGDRPLIIAARIGFVGIAEQLLARKAEVDAENRRGETALIVAVQARQAPMVKLLLENGADPDKRDNFGGRSARDYAKLDTRNKDMLKLIEATQARPAPKSVDEFTL